MKQKILTNNGLRGGLVVVSGPSGAGKTTIVNLLGKDPRVHCAVTATTRPRRPGEVDGVDYFFLTPEEFNARIDCGAFVEYNEVFRNGNLYGSLKSPLEAALRRKDCCYVLEIDIEGGISLLDQGYAGIYIFIAPPSMEELRRRIVARGTESAQAITQRIRKTRLEMKLKDRYEFVVINDDLKRAYQEVCRIIGLNISEAKTPPKTTPRGGNNP